MPDRRERRCIRDRWAYLARFVLLELWCAGQAAALRFLHGIRGGRSDRLRLTFGQSRLVEDGSEASTSRHPAGSTKKPQRRLKVIADRMPERKGELVALIHDWKVATPEDPTKMRIPDLRELLFEFDRVEDQRTQAEDQGKVIERWGQKRITFGKKYLGKTFATAYEDWGFTCWVMELENLRDLRDPNKGLEDFYNYAKTREAQRDPVQRWTERRGRSPSSPRSPGPSAQHNRRRGRSSSMSDEEDCRCA